VEINWEAVGAVLSGIGSIMSGYVAVRLARRVTVHLDSKDEKETGG
jgi:rRNA processing protein Gar1